MENEMSAVDRENERQAILKELAEIKLTNVGTDQNFSAEETAKRMKELEQRLQEIDPINANAA